MERDPFRCERCKVYYQPEVAVGALWLHGGYLRCVDLRECDGRLAFRESLDALISKTRAEADASPPEPVRRRPVLAHVPGGRRPGGYV